MRLDRTKKHGKRLKGHVLIIEDEALIAVDLENMLRDLGFGSFDFADNPAAALACAQTCRPDMITADVQIIGGSGAEAVEAIVAELGQIPIVYVTGNVGMLGPEAEDIVEKPINPGRLAAACTEAFGRAYRRDSPRPAANEDRR